MFEVSFSQSSRKVEFFPWQRLNSFFLLASALLRLVQWFVWSSYRLRFVLSFVCFFLHWWVRMSEVILLSADDGLVFLFCFLLWYSILNRVLWWLGDAQSCIQVISFLWVLTIWYSLDWATELNWTNWGLVRRGSHEQIPHIQGEEQWLRFAVAAVKRYRTSKVRETQIRG